MMKLKRNPGVWVDPLGHTHQGSRPRGRARMLWGEYHSNPALVLTLATGRGFDKEVESFYCGRMAIWEAVTLDKEEPEGLTLHINNRSLNFRSGSPAVLEFLHEAWRVRHSEDVTATDAEITDKYLGILDEIDKLESAVDEHIKALEELENE